MERYVLFEIQIYESTGCISLTRSCSEAVEVILIDLILIYDIVDELVPRLLLIVS
jgi:hypothetical protein